MRNKGCNREQKGLERKEGDDPFGELWSLGYRGGSIYAYKRDVCVIMLFMIKKDSIVSDKAVHKVRVMPVYAS